MHAVFVSSQNPSFSQSMHRPIGLSMMPHALYRQALAGLLLLCSRITLDARSLARSRSCVGPSGFVDGRAYKPSVSVLTSMPSQQM